MYTGNGHAADALLGIVVRELPGIRDELTGRLCMRSVGEGREVSSAYRGNELTTE